MSIYNYSFNPDQLFTKNFEILELEICSKIFTCGMIFLQVNSKSPHKSEKKYVLSLKSCIVPVKKPFIKERFDKKKKKLQVFTSFRPYHNNEVVCDSKYIYF